MEKEGSITESPFMKTGYVQKRTRPVTGYQIVSIPLNMRIKSCGSVQPTMKQWHDCENLVRSCGLKLPQLMTLRDDVLVRQHDLMPQIISIRPTTPNPNNHRPQRDTKNGERQTYRFRQPRRPTTEVQVPADLGIGLSLGDAVGLLRGKPCTVLHEGLDVGEAVGVALKQQHVALRYPGGVGGFQRDGQRRRQRDQDPGRRGLERVRHLFGRVGWRCAVDATPCRTWLDCSASVLNEIRAGQERDETAAPAKTISENSLESTENIEPPHTGSDDSPHGDGIPDGVCAEQGDGVGGLEAIFADERRAQPRGFGLDLVPVEALFRHSIHVPGELLLRRRRFVVQRRVRPRLERPLPGRDVGGDCGMGRER